MALKSRIKEAYDIEAKIYDKTREWFEKGRFAERERKLYREFLRRGSLVLMLASGTGRHFSFLVNTLGCEVVGVDISPGMAMVSKEKYKAIQHSVHLVIGDVEYLPFREGVFDAVLCSRALYLFSNKMKVLREAYMVVKKGGKVAISSVFKDLALTKLGIKLGLLSNDPSSYPYTSNDLVEMFRKIGFRNVYRKCIVVLTGSPRYIPQIVYKVLNKLEDKLRGGRWTIVVGEK